MYEKVHLSSKYYIKFFKEPKFRSAKADFFPLYSLQIWICFFHRSLWRKLWTLPQHDPKFLWLFLCNHLLEVFCGCCRIFWSEGFNWKISREIIDSIQKIIKISVVLGQIIFMSQMSSNQFSFILYAMTLSWNVFLYSLCFAWAILLSKNFKLFSWFMFNWYLITFYAARSRKIFDVFRLEKLALTLKKNLKSSPSLICHHLLWFQIILFRR